MTTKFVWNSKEWNMKVKFLIAVVVEIAYAVFTRAWLSGQLEGVYLEIAVSACRLATIAIYWGLFRNLILSRPKAGGTLRHPCLIIGVLVAMAIPFLFQGWSPGGGFGTALVFALTSVVVGLREELLYRAVLINFLQPRIGVAGALICSTVLFVVYHYGALPITWLTITEVTTLSLLMGLIYIRSGSLIAVVAFHSIYDAVWFFGPFPAVPVPDQWRPLFLLSALALVVLWWRFGVASSGQEVAASPHRLT